MTELVKQIRNQLKIIWYSNRHVSIKCKLDYTIHINSKLNISDLIDIVKNVYNKESHNWLCVFVNNEMMPIH